MRILLIEPYYGGSHRAWADGYQAHSQHDVTLLTLPAQFWKWRMQGGGVTLNRLLREHNHRPDIVLASDMMNMATFRALTNDYLTNTPIVTYFHETQLTYPQNKRQQHGWRYGFINYVSMLASDWSYFNSQYHRDIFLKTVPNMLKHFGDFNELDTVHELRAKSSVLPLGLDLKRFDAFKPPSHTPNSKPIILWNHRWEADKNPRSFFEAVYNLIDQGYDFQIAITGKSFRQTPEEFEQARRRLGSRLIHYGYLPNFSDYAHLLWQADYIVSTSNQEFFGGSVAQGIYCKCIPLLPNRLNYPYLMPDDFHDTCLFEGNSLQYLLRRHLDDEFDVNTNALSAFISQFDWSVIAGQYDRTFAGLLR